MERTCHCGKSCRQLSTGYCPRVWGSQLSYARSFGIRSCGNPGIAQADTARRNSFGARQTRSPVASCSVRTAVSLNGVRMSQAGHRVARCCSHFTRNRHIHGEARNSLPDTNLVGPYVRRLSHRVTCCRICFTRISSDIAGKRETPHPDHLSRHS